MRGAPALNAAIVATLAVAAGVNLAMLGLVDRLLLSPPPHLQDPTRVLRVTFASTDADGARGAMTTTSFPAFEAVRDHVPGFVDAGAFVAKSVTAAVGDERLQINGALVSGSYFDTLGATPLTGRFLRDEDDRTEANPVIVVSHRLWKARLAQSTQPVRAMDIGGRSFTIVGVAKPAFTGHTTAPVDVWLPITVGMNEPGQWRFNPGRNIVSIVVRLAPTISPDIAATQATAAAARPGQKVVLAPLVPGWAGAASSPDTQIALWLAGIAGLVFVTGVANASTLLLIAATRRSHDMAVRRALGASRTWLVAQVSLESTVLALAAIAAGAVLSWWIAEAVRRILLPSLAPDEALMNGRLLALLTLAAVVSIAAMTAIVAPRVARASDTDELRGRDGDLHTRARRTQTALLVVQMSLAMVLVVGAGLFGRSLYNVRAQDFGFEPRNLLLAGFEPGPGLVSNQSEIFLRALDRVRRTAGVIEATVVQATPFAAHNVPPIAVPGLADPPSVDGQLPFLSAATPEFFSVLGMTLTRGRLLNAADERGTPVAVVNESMARGAWPGRDPIGQCFRIGFGPDFDPFTADGPPVPPLSLPCREVVGVVKDMRQRSVLPDGGEDRLMQYFVPFSQMPAPPMGDGNGAEISGLLVRVRAGVDRVDREVGDALAAAANDVAPVKVQRYEDLFERQMRPWQLGATLLVLFGGIALVMGSVGVYAAFAHVVSSRQRELAIRSALGADRAQLARMVFGNVLVVAATGIGVGGALALAGGQYIASLLFRTVPYDPVVFAGAAALVSAIAAIAGTVPSRSASRTEPSTLLRT